MNYLLFLCYVLMSSSGLILIKLGSVRNNMTIRLVNGVLSGSISVLTIAGIICYVLSFVLYMRLVSMHDLSRIFPLGSGFVYLIIALASVILLKEQISLYTIIGGSLIVVGLFFINLK